MSDVKTWFTVADSNTGLVPDYPPEGWAPADVNNCLREVMAALRRQMTSLDFFDQNPTTSPYNVVLTKLSNTQIQLTGADYTAIYTKDRRIRILGTTPASDDGFVESSSFGAGNTVVTVTMDHGVLPSAPTALLAGTQPTASRESFQGSALPGEIRDFFTHVSKLPTGWLVADFSAVSRTTYADLFSALTVALGAATVLGSKTVTGISSTAGLAVGMPVEGAGVPSGTAILSIDGGTQIKLSKAATANGSPTLTFFLVAGVSMLYGTLTTGSNNVYVASTAGLVAGMPITGTGIPAGSAVLSVVDGNNFTLQDPTGGSANATSTGTFQTFVHPVTGNGDGSTTFNLPDLRGRGRVGFTAGGDADGDYATVGGAYGEKSHQLLPSELAAHTHSLNDSGHFHQSLVPGNLGAGGYNVTTNPGNVAYANTTSVLTGVSVNTSGGNAPHENRSPTVTVLTCIHV